MIHTFWITSWTCLEISGLKLIFHWTAHFVILVRSFVKWFDDVLIICIVANNEVLSANRFGLHWSLSDKSLIWIRNKRGPRIDPCGTPLRASLQDECLPFRTTLCFRDFKKSVKTFIDKSRLIKEYPCLEPDWFEHTNSFSMQNQNISLYIRRSNFFPKIGRVKQVDNF